MQQWGYHAKPNPQDHGANARSVPIETLFGAGVQCTKKTKNKTMRLNGKEMRRHGRVEETFRGGGGRWVEG
jgi:hypothetical protein